MSFCYFNKQNSQSSDSEFFSDDTRVKQHDGLDGLSNTNSNSSSSSSRSSCLWSLESRKQNWELWEHIERIFYGEDPLPTDEKTREEFLEWMTAFPHLRVIGKKLPLPLAKNPKLSYEFIDEIIAIDPVEPSFTVLDNEISKHKIRFSHQEGLKSHDIEKYLTSGSILKSQKSITNRSAVKNPIRTKTVETVTRQQTLHKDLNHNFTYCEIPKILGQKYLFKHSNLDSEANFKIKSATAVTNSKLPNYELIHEKRARIRVVGDLNSKSSKSATVSKMSSSKTGTVFLPSLHLPLHNEIIGRSISAVSKK